jgi:DNA mismatch repair protein MSH3
VSYPIREGASTDGIVAAKTLKYAQCTPQELAVLLQAFNKIATAYDSFEGPPDVGFKSKILNDILFSLPKLKNPINGFLGDISLKKASEGRMDMMWTDPEKYPSIADIDLVCVSSLSILKGCSIKYGKAIQAVEVELQEELKLSRSPPSLLS